ncbi:MAG: ester cyclase [Burkholderiales bacterium]
MLVDGNRVIVRSEASGTPAGPFFGVPHGGKSSRIMTIDIHTVQGGKLVEAHHVENRAGAIRQLSAK